jgi:hypothetical protein
MGLIGGKDGTFGFANLGVLVALVLGYVGTLVLRRDAVRRQEGSPVAGAAKTLS